MSADVVNAKARVTVIIPSYNLADYLPAAIDSVCAQTLPPLEVIVIDDGSTDGSWELAEAYGPPVQVVRQANAGVSAARNHGIDLAAGDWIAFLDADDIWEPTKLERQMAAVADQPEVVCVFTDFYTFGEGRENQVELRPDHTMVPDFRARMLCEYSLLPSAAVVRAESISGLRFQVGVTDSEDMLFFLELRECGPFAHVAEPLLGYRIVSTSAVRRAGHELRSVGTRFGYLQEYADRFTEEERLAVRRHLALNLLRGHDRALWRDRDPAMVRAYRELFFRVRPPDLEIPENFSQRLYPRWMYRVRDALASLKKR